MVEKTGRNDPCPCGSGKKYKNCCMKMPSGSKKVFKASVVRPQVQGPKPIDLMERTFGDAIARSKGEPPPSLSERVKEKEKNEEKT